MNGSNTEVTEVNEGNELTKTVVELQAGIDEKFNKIESVAKKIENQASHIEVVEKVINKTRKFVNNARRNKRNAINSITRENEIIEKAQARLKQAHEVFDDSTAIIERNDRRVKHVENIKTRRDYLISLIKKWNDEIGEDQIKILKSNLSETKEVSDDSISEAS